METQTSIAGEFFKLREEWARADKLKSWRLAIWVAQYADLDIIDKFIETERLPVGMFNDIFFRFDTEFKNNIEEFEKQLWKEYESWFNPANEKQDLLLALKNDQLLADNFIPKFDCESGFEGLMKEMLRLKAQIPAFEKVHFCIYFPPCRPDANYIGSWLQQKMKKQIDPQIRLLTIDFAAARTINITDRKCTEQTIEIVPHLNMLQAINNEMDKAGGSSDVVSVENRFRKQIRVVMETTLKQNQELTSKEVKTMLSISKEMGTENSIISALLIAAQAHYNIKDHHQCEWYADEAIKKSEVLMQQGDPAGYHTWKSCMMLKGGLLSAKRKWEEAIVIYENMATQATQHGDTFFIMEGYRISGHLFYLRGRLQQAFEYSLLAMVAGSHLDKAMIRESTFLHAAYVALFIARNHKTTKEVQIVEEQLAQWVGEDWRDIIDISEMEKAIVKPKSKIATAFSALTNSK
jgi:hypothetical protein